MANSAQAKKRARQADKRRMANKGKRSMMRSSIKAVIAAIESGNKEEAQTAFAAAVPVIDRMAGKGLIHKNKAARHKSRLNTAIQAL